MGMNITGCDDNMCSRCWERSFNVSKATANHMNCTWDQLLVQCSLKCDCISPILPFWRDILYFISYSTLHFVFLILFRTTQIQQGSVCSHNHSTKAGVLLMYYIVKNFWYSVEKSRVIQSYPSQTTKGSQRVSHVGLIFLRTDEHKWNEINMNSVVLWVHAEELYKHTM